MAARSVPDSGFDLGLCFLPTLPPGFVCSKSHNAASPLRLPARNWGFAAHPRGYSRTELGSDARLLLRAMCR